MQVYVFSRFSRGSDLWKVLFSVVFLTFIPWASVFVESHSNVRLAYICVEPDSVPVGESNVPVIMLHAVMDVKETWNGIYERVSAATKRKVCIYDARNHGESSWNDTSTISSTVEDLESFMDMMKIDRAMLVGHSLGGHTAMKFALSYPSRVERIFVEDIGPSVPSEVELAIAYFIRVLERSLSTIPDAADKPTGLKTVLKYIRKRTAGLMPQSYNKYMPIYLHDGVWQWKINLKSMNKALDDLSSVYTKMEGEFEGKALFIYGTSSVFRVSDQLEDIRKLFPNVEFVAVETRDHFIHFVYSDYTKLLVDFLK